jgi:hypothetical protein
VLNHGTAQSLSDEYALCPPLSDNLLTCGESPVLSLIALLLIRP